MINQLYTTKGNYIFNQIAHLVCQYKANNTLPPLSLGVGDAVLPIAPCVATAMSNACMQLADINTFVGYGSEYGLPCYIDAIYSYYANMGVNLLHEEIFASDGAISQLCDIIDILDISTVALPDPSYPVYRDNALLQKLNVVTLPNCGMLSDLPHSQVDALYLCNPTNPTGMCYDKAQLQQWVNYCNSNNVVLIYDSAYSSFVQGDMPKSIYEITGAKSCAIEICSLSKSASFTGIRCGYTVVPMQLHNANKAWRTRLSYKTNGVSYISQIGGTSALSQQGMQHTQYCTDYYLDNMQRLRNALQDNLHVVCHGGTHSPYLWVQCPNNLDSWQFFQLLLERYGIVTLPGVGMGEYGQGYIRVSGFCLHDTVEKIQHRLSTMPNALA